MSVLQHPTSLNKNSHTKYIDLLYHIQQNYFLQGFRHFNSLIILVKIFKLFAIPINLISFYLACSEGVLFLMCIVTE